jgi:hypothetical protein
MACGADIFSKVLVIALCLFGFTSTVLFTAERPKNELGRRLALSSHRRLTMWTVMKTMLPTITASAFFVLNLNLGFRNILRR